MDEQDEEAAERGRGECPERLRQLHRGVPARPTPPKSRREGPGAASAPRRAQPPRPAARALHPPPAPRLEAPLRAAIASFWEGGGERGGAGRGRAGAGRLAESLGPRRPPLRPLGHHRGLRGAGGPGAGGRPPRPHESAPPTPEPRRQQGPDGRPRTAQRPGLLRLPPASRRPRSLRPGAQGAARPPPRRAGLGAGAARSARGFRTIAAAGARAARPGPPRSNLRGPGPAGRVPAGRCRPPRCPQLAPPLPPADEARAGALAVPALRALPVRAAAAVAGRPRRQVGPATLRAWPPAGRRCSGPRTRARRSLGLAAPGDAARGNPGPARARRRLRSARPADAHWAAEGTRGTPAALQRPRLARRRVRRGRSSRKPRVGLHLGAQGPHCRAGRVGGGAGSVASRVPSLLAPQGPWGDGERGPGIAAAQGGPPVVPVKRTSARKHLHRVPAPACDILPAS